MDIMKEIDRRIVFWDGGMGSLLQERGLQPGELPETWNILHPDIVTEIHREYIEAGADIIDTNTFGANRLKFPDDGEFPVPELVRAAVKNVREAEKLAGRKVFAALDIGPTGKLLKPLGDLGFEEAYDLFAQVVRAGEEAGADLVLAETMSDSYEVKAAILAAKENSHLPVMATMIFDEKGKLLTGGNVASTVALLEGLGVDALGINCGLGPVQMEGILLDLLQYASVPVIMNPNAGLPRSENGKTVYDINAEEFAEVMERMVRHGVRVAGGCCGTTPEHIRQLRKRCEHLTPVPVVPKNRTFVSSYANAVEIGPKPVIIGERINPTGKSKFKQALRDHDMDYILKEAVTQQDAGAHILDVNVGLPEIDEPSMMEEAIRELQTVTDLPLQIDTSDFTAMERAMRIYNGKPLINSVNGKDEVMDAVFPLVKKYGGTVVALALDENGIPDNADGRIAIARRIYAKAASYGIAAKDIIIDGLAMTISSDNRSALATLETLRRVRDELGGHTILGVSNISFGLPARPNINAAFYTMAMQNGLSAAIINPNSEDMMRAYFSYCALAGLDENCQDYIARYAGQTTAAPAAAKGDLPLQECIRKGLKEQTAAATAALLKTTAPLDVINQELIPALDVVGKGFEKGTVFLPQLLMSAEAAKAAFDVIKQQMADSGVVQEKKGKIILATVKGDIHDIGKNIVKVLLENYSYDVIDLGRDVPPETIVETALAQQVKLVGLSALMTTTVPSMEETIRQLNAADPTIKVMVGGAVLTQEYADTIHADAYCKDAMASVNYAGQVLGRKEGQGV
ncbi:homocysteine S-methyltransferase family protein [Oscillospiraceae bacterium Marseille-Q3528]|nr:homocysteine S-methyltransferase family protein [Oscillospiraceae bacterium Marseille-Q3528]